MSIRVKRVGQEIRKVLSARLLRDYREELGGVVSISDVEMNPKLTHAKVFFSVFGDDAEGQRVLKVLQEAKPRLRYEVGREVKLRVTPDLVFVFDSSPQRAQRITDLLKDTNEKKTDE